MPRSAAEQPPKDNQGYAAGRPRRHVVEHKGRPIYHWEQTPTEVTIFIQSPPSTSKPFCNISENFVQLGALTPRLPCSWFLNHYTGGLVNEDKSYWKNENGTCTIVLAKAKPGASWRYALRDERDETTQNPRPKVRPLANPKQTQQPRTTTPVRRRDAPPISPVRQATRRNLDATPISPVRRPTHEIGSGPDAGPVSPKRDVQPRNIDAVVKDKTTTKEGGRRKQRPVKTAPVMATPVKAKPPAKPLSAKTPLSLAGTTHHHNNTSSFKSQAAEQAKKGLPPHEDLEEMDQATPEDTATRRKSNSPTPKQIYMMQRLLKEKDMELHKQQQYLNELEERIEQLEAGKQRETRDKSLSATTEVDELQGSEIETHQVELDPRTEASKVLQEKLALQKRSLDEQQKLIDSQAASIQTKQKLIQSLQRKLQEQKKEPLVDRTSSDEPKVTKEAWKASQLQIQQLQNENKKARKQTQELERELEEQMMDWRELEQEMENTLERVGTLEAQLTTTRKEKGPVVADVPFKENSVNEYLDRLSRKMVHARNQLEEVSRRRKTLMHQRRVAPVDVISTAKTC
eukprot:scaffold2533_cov137-Cylindrotheca_fusiformis.AAC.25